MLPSSIGDIGGDDGIGGSDDMCGDVGDVAAAVTTSADWIISNIVNGSAGGTVVVTDDDDGGTGDGGLDGSKDATENSVGSTAS